MTNANNHDTVTNAPTNKLRDDQLGQDDRELTNEELNSVSGGFLVYQFKLVGVKTIGQ